MLASGAEDDSLRLRGSFPFNVKLTPKDREIKQRAAYMGYRRYVVSNNLYGGATQNPIYGGVFLGDDTGTELIIWWGLIEEGTSTYKDHKRNSGPRLWNGSIPVCFIQAWTNLTGSRTFNAQLAESLSGEILDESVSLPPDRPSVVEVEDGLALKDSLHAKKPMAPETVVELFTQCAQPVMDCVGWNMRLRASMHRVEFLGRLLCELDVEVL